MRTLHMLLGCSERRTSAIIEATVLDVCYNRAAVNTSKVSRLGEFTRAASASSIELMVLVTDHLLPEPRQGEPTPEALVQAMWVAKNRCAAPLLVLGGSPENEYRFLEAGADAVLSFPLQPDQLRIEADRLLSLPQNEEEVVSQPKWSFTSLFSRNRQS